MAAMAEFNAKKQLEMLHGSGAMSSRRAWGLPPGSNGLLGAMLPYS